VAINDAPDRRTGDGRYQQGAGEAAEDPGARNVDTGSDRIG